MIFGDLGACTSGVQRSLVWKKVPWVLADGKERNRRTDDFNEEPARRPAGGTRIDNTRTLCGCVVAFADGRALRFGEEPNKKILIIGSREETARAHLLLDRLHNGFDSQSMTKTEDLRLDIDARKRKIVDTILAWQDAKERNDLHEEMIHRKKLQRYLSRKASYTMLMRSTLVVRKYVIGKGVELD